MFTKDVSGCVTTSSKEDFNATVIRVSDNLYYGDEKKTLDLLIKEGYTESEAGLLIAAAKVLNK